MAESVRDQVYKPSVETAQLEVAKNLKVNWKVFSDIVEQTGGGTLAPAPVLPPNATPEQKAEFTKQDAEFNDLVALYGRNLVNHGRTPILFADGTQREVSLAELDGRVDQLTPAVRDGVKEKLKSAMGTESLQEGIPSAASFDKIAKATEEAVEQEKNNKLPLFLSALMTWIGAFLSSIFGDGERISFKEAMAQVSSSKINESVRSRLALESEKDPAVKRILETRSEKGTTLDLLGANLRKGTYEFVGVAAPQDDLLTPQPKVILANVSVNQTGLPTPDDAYRGIVAKAMEKGKDGKTLEDMLTQKFNDGIEAEKDSYKDKYRKSSWMPSFLTEYADKAVDKLAENYKAPKPEEVGKAARELAPEFAAAFARAVIDPNLKDEHGKPVSSLNQEAFAKAVAKNVTESISARADEWGAIGKINKDLADGLKTRSDEINKTVYAKVIENYDPLIAAREIVVRNPERQLAANLPQNTVDPSLQQNTTNSQATNITLDPSALQGTQHMAVTTR